MIGPYSAGQLAFLTTTVDKNRGQTTTFRAPIWLKTIDSRERKVAVCTRFL
jgi:hypothetical protein